MTRACGLYCVLFCLGLQAQSAAPISFINVASYWSALIQGSDGNFYGLSGYAGTGVCQASVGSGPCGAVFKLTPDGTVSVLYSFQPGPERRELVSRTLPAYSRQRTGIFMGQRLKEGRDAPMDAAPCSS